MDAPTRRLQDAAPDSGSTAFLLLSAALVGLMIPALALFYGGLVSARSVTHTMVLSFVSWAVIGLVWSLIGYSLAFGPNPGPLDGWIGGWSYGAFDSPDRLRDGTAVPEGAFMMFQLAFASIAAAVVSGSVVSRISIWAWAAFSALWCLLVYVPLARWIFYENGWLFTYGVLDFAGGLVVETASGVSAFVLAYHLGHGVTRHAPAHNQTYVLIGVGLLFMCVPRRAPAVWGSGGR